MTTWLNPDGTVVASDNFEAPCVDCGRAVKVDRGIEQDHDCPMPVALRGRVGEAWGAGERWVLDHLADYGLSRVAGPGANDGQVLAEIAQERTRQDAKWGEQNHPDGTGAPGSAEVADSAREACDRAAEHGVAFWSLILLEEVSEAIAESDPAALRGELVQVAAVAVNWIEAIDRRNARGDA